MTEDRLHHSGYQRGGLVLEVGRLWEIDCGERQPLRELSVFANEYGIRIVDMDGGEWEDAERHAVRLDADMARALGEILFDAAREQTRQASIWHMDANQADPGPALERALLERLTERDHRAQTAADEAIAKGPVDVTLEAAGDKKIAVIKVLRDEFCMYLDQAKEVVDTTPRVIRSGVGAVYAHNLAKRLTEVGATVTVTPTEVTAP